MEAVLLHGADECGKDIHRMETYFHPKKPAGWNADTEEGSQTGEPTIQAKSAVNKIRSSSWSPAVANLVQAAHAISQPRFSIQQPKIIFLEEGHALLGLRSSGSYAITLFRLDLSSVRRSVTDGDFC
jgi:hypothetical protein